MRVNHVWSSTELGKLEEVKEACVAGEEISFSYREVCQFTGGLQDRMLFPPEFGFTPSVIRSF